MSQIKYTIAVDLGENHVIAMAGHRDESGMIQISGIARRPMQGLRAGRIENIALINGALSGAISELESKLNIKIQLAYGGISGEYIRCGHHSETILVEDPGSGVAKRDVVALQNLMRQVQAPEGDTILEYNPICYMVERNKELKNPVGSFGTSLSASYIFTLCDKESLKRLNQGFEQAGIALKRCFANSVSTADAVLTADEKEAGVAMVDLGEGITNLAIYYRSALRYMISIPIGGSAINNDLAQLMIHERNIEEKKRKYGSAIADKTKSGSIAVAGRTARENRSIPLYNVVLAIQERVKDIINFVEREIKDAGFEGRLGYGIVLTGGGSKLRDIDELFRRTMGVDVRIGIPEEEICFESRELIASTDYSTVVGILRRGIELDEKKSGKDCAIILDSAAIAEEVAKKDKAAAKEAEKAKEASNDTEDDEEEKELNDSKSTRKSTKRRKKVAEPDPELELMNEDEEEESDEDDDNDDSTPNKEGGSMSNLFKSWGNKLNSMLNSGGDTELK
ncbi:MAG: cell division protein FtsA [Rikenellaceae bacterium]